MQETDWPTTEVTPVQTLQNAQLDSEELFHLAVLDTQAARHDEAIRKLKEAVSLSPDHARATYLLGAEYAEIGLFDRAVEAMQRAIKLDPSMVTAHFQLGLVQYAQGNANAAQSTWQVLDSMPDSDSLVAFKTALLQVSASEFSDAIASLERGIALVSTNPALLKDMQNVKTNVEKHLLTLAQNAETAASGTGAGANHLLLSSYRQVPGTDK